MRKIIISITFLVLLTFIFSLANTWAGGSTNDFLEQWALATSPYMMELEGGNNLVIPAVDEDEAVDGKIAQLQLAANTAPGPTNGAQVRSNSLVQFGTYSARFKTVDCTTQTNIGVVTGFFTYFNDGQDYNNNKLPDNSEIDFEWLCAEPQVVYLTMWTDYSEMEHRRITRKINLQTGVIEHTCYYEDWENCQALIGIENQPISLDPLLSYSSPTTFYEYGFDWHTDQVVWWLRQSPTSPKIVLWDYQGPAERIAQLPSYLMVNTWHTTNWTPTGMPKAVQPPQTAVKAEVDWVQYLSEKQIFLPLLRK